MYDYTIERAGKNSLLLRHSVRQKRDLHISDVHFDNVKCDRDKLKVDLDLAESEGMGIIINGDTLCAMQGPRDRRSSYGSLRTENKRNDYFNSLVEDATEFFLPYADNIIAFGYGNHETSIISHHGVDLVSLLVGSLNAKGEQRQPIMVGAYRWWLTHAFSRGRAGAVYREAYYHGSGGAPRVSRAAIKITRQLEVIDGCDALYLGHYHYASIERLERWSITTAGRETMRNVLAVATPTYKREFDGDFSGGMGFAIEKDLAPKPIGGVIVEQECIRDLRGGGDRETIHATAWFT